MLGFNSAKYDINLIKMVLAKTLKLHETNDYFVVKKNNQYMCVANPEFRFLDISNYLASGYSYAKILKAYQTEEFKFYFPYEWFDDERKLEATSLPPPEAFYSMLNQKNTLGDGEGLIQNYEML